PTEPSALRCPGRSRCLNCGFFFVSRPLCSDLPAARQPCPVAVLAVSSTLVRKRLPPVPESGATLRRPQDPAQPSCEFEVHSPLFSHCPLLSVTLSSSSRAAAPLGATPGFAARKQCKSYYAL